MKNDTRRFQIKSLYMVALVLLSAVGSAQITNGLTANEKRYYSNLKELCNSLHESKHLDDSAVGKFILLDYVLNDTSKTRISDRMVKIKSLLVNFGSFIDSVGLSNLDAAPLREYISQPKVDSVFMSDLKASIPNIFAYFRKDNRKSPLGYVLFDPKSMKIVSWILLNQGRTYYFLTFNLF